MEQISLEKLFDNLDKPTRMKKSSIEEKMLHLELVFPYDPLAYVLEHGSETNNQLVECSYLLSGPLTKDDEYVLNSFYYTTADHTNIFGNEDAYIEFNRAELEEENLRSANEMREYFHNKFCLRAMTDEKRNSDYETELLRILHVEPTRKGEYRYRYSADEDHNTFFRILHTLRDVYKRNLQYDNLSKQFDSPSQFFPSVFDNKRILSLTLVDKVTTSKSTGSRLQYWFRCTDNDHNYPFIITTVSPIEITLMDHILSHSDILRIHPKTTRLSNSPGYDKNVYFLHEFNIVKE